MYIQTNLAICGYTHVCAYIRCVRICTVGERGAKTGQLARGAGMDHGGEGVVNR